MIRKPVAKAAQKMVDTKTCAEMYSVSPGHLANLRSQKAGVKYYKVGAKILYDVDDLEAYFKANPVLTSGSPVSDSSK